VQKLNQFVNNILADPEVEIVLTKTFLEVRHKVDSRQMRRNESLPTLGVYRG